jgi:hypothetical protein
MYVMAMNDNAEYHRVTLGLDEAGYTLFFLERLRSGEVVVQLSLWGLNTDLNMIEPGLLEFDDFFLIQPVSRGNEIRVVPQFTCLSDERHQILSNQRLPARKTQLNSAHTPGFREHPNPVFGAKFIAMLCIVDGIGAVRTLERAPISQFRK